MKTPHSSRPTPHDYSEPRPRIAPASDLVNSLCYVIRDQLYRDDQKKYFHSQLKDLKTVVTYPAAWLNKKGVFVTPDRYKEIVMNILQEVKRNGDTGAINYWPRYLMKVFQTHFQHSGSRYYLEGKTARDVLARIPLQARPESVEAAGEALVRELSAARQILKSPGGRSTRSRSPQASAAAPAQPSLFDLPAAPQQPSGNRPAAPLPPASETGQTMAKPANSNPLPGQTTRPDRFTS